MTIANAVSLIGRIIPLFFAQRLGPINVLATFAMVSGIMMMCWTLAHGKAGIFTYDALYGIASGGYGASFNPGAASFAPHTNQSGLYLGMAFFTTAWFWLAGTPITAELISGRSSYLAASMFCGGVVMSGAAILFVSRTIRAKQLKTRYV